MIAAAAISTATTTTSTITSATVSTRSDVSSSSMMSSSPVQPERNSSRDNCKSIQKYHVCMVYNIIVVIVTLTDCISNCIIATIHVFVKCFICTQCHPNVVSLMTD